MKRSNIFVFICLIGSACSNFASAGTQCTASSIQSSHQGVADAANGVNNYCFHTPESMNIKLYEFGLCTGPSSPSNKSSCTALFESNTGKEMNLSVGSSLELADNVSLSEGIYTHAYLLMSNVTSIKSVISLTPDRQDDRSGSGKYCYTDGRSIDSSASIMSCSDDPTQAVASQETIGLSSGNTYSATLLNFIAIMNGTSVVTDLYMTTSDGTLSTATIDDFAIYGSQTLGSSVSVTPETTGLNIAFSISDGVTLGFGSAASNAAPDDAVFEGLKFQISAN